MSILLASCAGKDATTTTLTIDPITQAAEVPNITVNDSLLHYDNQTSQWTLEGQLYSGYAAVYYQDSVLAEKKSILNGRKQNQCMQWYPDGQMKEIANYHEGKLHGEKKRWSLGADHILISQLNYYLGKAHGEQKLWYPSGELFKKMNLNMGKEEGIQQAFRKSGDLFANYEAKEGRTFGLRKTALCFGLEDQNIQYEE